MSEPFERIEAKIRAFADDNSDITRWQLAHRLREFRAWLGDASDAELADRYWRLLCTIELAPRTIVVRFSPWVISGRAELAVALLSELARGLGEGFDDVRQAFATLLKRLSELAPFIGAALEASVGGFSGNLFSIGGQLSARIATKLVSGPNSRRAEK